MAVAEEERSSPRVPKRKPTPSPTAGEGVVGAIRRDATRAARRSNVTATVRRRSETPIPLAERLGEGACKASSLSHFAQNIESCV